MNRPLSRVPDRDRNLIMQLAERPDIFGIHRDARGQTFSDLSYSQRLIALCKELRCT